MGLARQWLLSVQGGPPALPGSGGGAEASLLARTPNPTAAELVEAFAGPLFEKMPADAEGGARTARLIVTIFGDPAEETPNWTGPAEDTVRDRYLAAFGRALPGLSRRSCGSG